MRREFSENTDDDLATTDFTSPIQEQQRLPRYSAVVIKTKDAQVAHESIPLSGLFSVVHVGPIGKGKQRRISIARCAGKCFPRRRKVSQILSRVRPIRRRNMFLRAIVPSGANGPESADNEDHLRDSRETQREGQSCFGVAYIRRPMHSSYTGRL